jgi:hypothetical protein
MTSAEAKSLAKDIAGEAAQDFYDTLVDGFTKPLVVKEDRPFGFSLREAKKIANQVKRYVEQCLLDAYNEKGATK